jgi:plastocyanin
MWWPTSGDQVSSGGTGGGDLAARDHRSIGDVASAAALRIEVKDLAFAPAEITAHIGDIIEWMNDDFVAHTATARDSQWDLKLPPHASGRTIIRSAGKVEYYCRYHPNMKAEMTVESK